LTAVVVDRLRGEGSDDFEGFKQLEKRERAGKWVCETTELKVTEGLTIREARVYSQWHDLHALNTSQEDLPTHMSL
jgi:hypothetical protein